MIALALLAFAQAATLPDFAEPARTGQHNPKDAAVVIGVEDYFDVPDVPFARADAQAFDDFIRYTRGVADDRVTRLLDARAGDIRRAVQDQGKRVGPGGTLWVYFAGHGAMDPTAERRLLLGRDASTDPTQFADFAVAVDDVRSWATSGGGDVMLVVDACYNGGGRTGEGVLTGGRRLVVPNYALQSGNHATEWAATAPQELSAPLTAVSHGAFTYFAVGALRGWADGEVDGTRDGNVTAEEANKYVARSLRAVQTQGQTPQLSTTDASKLVLARGVKELGPGREDLALLRGGSAVASAPVGAPVVVPRTGDAVVQTDGKDLDFAELARQAQLQDQAAAAARDAAEQAAAAARDAAAKAAADEQRRAAAAAKLQAEKDAAAQALKDELERRLAAERKQKMDAAAEELQAAASRDYAAISALVASPSNAGQPVLEAWLARYGTAKVSVDGVSQAVVVVEADKVRAALQKGGSGPAASGSDYESKSLGTMKWIPAGTFTMGSAISESDRDPNESPHSVTLTKGYYLMEHEVTQAEWQAVMGENPSRFTACGRTCPVEQVSWNDAVDFAQQASARDGVKYTLPTEAQWEYAARGGQTRGQQTLYSGSNEAASVGWNADNSSNTTHMVCAKARNGYGLCDMTGNVWEWTSDFYANYGDSTTDPVGALSGSDRVYRGGSWHSSVRYARVARRNRDAPSYRLDSLGFRLARMSQKLDGGRTNSGSASSRRDRGPLSFAELESLQTTGLTQATHDTRLDSIERLKALLREFQGPADQKAELIQRLAGLYFAEGHALYVDEIRSCSLQIDNVSITSVLTDRADCVAQLTGSRQWQERTIKLFQQVIVNYPQFPRADEATFYLGCAFNDTAQTDLAVQEFTRLLEQYPDSAYSGDAYALIGEYYFDKREINNAISAYKHAAVDPTHDKYPFAMYKLAWCYYTLGDLGNAITTMNIAIEQTRSGELQNYAQYGSEIFARAVGAGR